MKISSQYSTPDTHNDFIELVNGYHFMFEYSMVETRQLHIPNKQNCRDYSSDHLTSRSKDECLVTCI